MYLYAFDAMVAGLSPSGEVSRLRRNSNRNSAFDMTAIKILDTQDHIVQCEAEVDWTYAGLDAGGEVSGWLI